MKNSVKFSKNIAVINTAYEEMIANAKRFRDKMDVFGETNGLGIEQLGLSSIYFQTNNCIRFKTGAISIEDMDNREAFEDIPYYLDGLIRNMEYERLSFDNGKSVLLKHREKEGFNIVYSALCSLVDSCENYIKTLKKFSEVLDSFPLPLTREEMKRLALLDLESCKYIPDSEFEGERTWLGIYARPVGTPKYGLDPDDYEEAQAMDGYDYSKWFEWHMSDLLELQKKYPL